MKFVKDLNLSYLLQNISFNTDMSRHYYELQLRDMENLSDPADIPASVAKDFLWNRDFALRWDLTKNLRMNFTGHSCRDRRTLWSGKQDARSG